MSTLNIFDLGDTVVLLVAAGLAMAVVILVALYLAGLATSERMRLPEAVRLRQLDEMIGTREARKQDLDDQIAERSKAVAERDQAEAEAEQWRSMAESARVEYDNLGEKRQEIEQVQEEYRQAVEQLGTKEGELHETRNQLERAQQDKKTAEDALKAAQDKQSDADQAAEDAERRRQEAESQEGQVQERVNKLQKEAETARQTAAEARAEADQKRSELDKLLERETALNQQVSEQQRRLETIEQQISDLDEKRQQAAETEENLRDLKAKERGLTGEIEDKESKRSYLHARLADLERIIEERKAGVPDPVSAPSGSGGTKPSEDEVLADLRRPPACLSEGNQRWPTPQPVDQAHDEKHALDRVHQSLNDSGLLFSRRTINAFHTSLKTATISPMTVLAGISGTGKSQLPQRYADAMGIHFLKIPVQPRWDSPQDLLGFYNYIENRYKATELARALVHLDEHNWEEQAADFKDRMVMVLLDEMNLARVEYYFAEFLSRLEGRPLQARAGDNGAHQHSEIEIGVSTEEKGSYRVYPGQNVLFCGTMNEDESTLTLSDKVLDRANVLRFPRPGKLERERPQDSDSSVHAGGYLPKSKWLKSWMRTPRDLQKSAFDRATTAIDDINEVMAQLDRPFGHRMSQAMLHYAANYPGSLDVASTQKALADQVEQRILPKLGGIPVDDSSRALHQLSEIVREQLDDGELAQEIERQTQDNAGLGLFKWRGFPRSLN